jgi:DnaJ homolog subfamily A member 5
MKTFVEQDWMRAPTPSYELDELKINDSQEEIEENEEDEYEEEDGFFCVGCNKAFKSEKAFINHEKSKKHKENIEFLKKQMKQEDLDFLMSQNRDEIDKEDEKPKQKYIYLIL